jgi:hypothetical protein
MLAVTTQAIIAAMAMLISGTQPIRAGSGGGSLA